MSATMRAMLLVQPGQPLVLRTLPRPTPGPGQVLLRVLACGVCRTDLHVFDGELTQPKLPLVLGHEIVGEVAGLGAEVSEFAVGDRVGVPWLGHTCADCAFCASGQENLCDAARFTGYEIDGGYAEFCTADARFCFALPQAFDDLHAAPLLCAGLIGYRAYRMAGGAGDDHSARPSRLGIYGFGAAAHIIAQVAVHEGLQVFAFTKAGDVEGQVFARELGATWAGDSDQRPPEELDAAILFAPVGSLVPAALRATRRGGTVVCAGIHMSDIPSFPYGILWGERVVRSVANLTRRDGIEFLEIAARVPVQVHPVAFRLDQANEALSALRAGELIGAAVLLP